MLKMLVADDNFVNRKLLMQLLRDKAVCDAAASGAETLEAYNLSLRERRPYDIILLDISMPDIGGLQVLRLIRESEARAGVSAGEGVAGVMVTAYQEPFAQAFNAGCDDYVLKPVEPGDLYAKIDKIAVSRAGSGKEKQ